MKALLQTGVETLEYVDAPDPAHSPGNLLLDIHHVGICGSDMHAYLGHDERRPTPLILGHEAAGTGTDGKRYTVNPLVTCGVCRFCRSGRENLCPERQIISLPPRAGAFAEKLVMPTGNLIEIPDGVSTAVASMAEPLACGWHAVRLARETLGQPIETATCLVYGGGAIGLGAALCLAAQGATEIWIAETNPVRLPILEAAGDFRVFNPMETDGPMADLIVDGVGYEATRTAATKAAHPGAVIAHIGLGGGAPGLDIRRMTLQEITFIGTYTYTAQDFRDTARAIFDGRLGPVDWPEIRPLSDGARAFEDIRAGQVAAPKIILEP